MTMWSTINRLKVKVFLLTFLSYSTYTGTRLAYSTTKSSLNAPDTGYAPFNGPQGATYLGALDTVFLTCYAAGLFISGIIGDRVNIKLFLTAGMCVAGTGVIMFGLADWLGVHALWYFILANIISGFGQSTGWPSNVTIMSRFFGHGSRGTVLGVWNSHGSIGSIVFKVLCNAAIVYIGWRYAFIIPGCVCIGVGLLILATLDTDPKAALTSLQYNVFMRELHPHGNGGGSRPAAETSDSTDDISQHIVPINVQPASSPHNKSATLEHEHEHEAISFRCALMIPGVLTYSVCLAFSKFIVYSFIMWLPFYLSVIGYSSSTANNLSAVYDAGGIIGGIVAGYVSDRLAMRGVTCMGMLLLAVPTMYVYMSVAASSELINGLVMFVVGIVTLGPYTLVSSAVAADLGQHVSLHGNPKAMSTVTGIIDGVGSIGGAMSGVACSYVGNTYGWDAVLYMLMITATVSAACLTRVVYGELRKRDTTAYEYIVDDKDSDAERSTPTKSQPLLGNNSNRSNNKTGY